MPYSQLFREIINSEDDVYSFGCILLEVLTGPSYFEKGEAYIVNELVCVLSFYIFIQE